MMLGLSTLGDIFPRIIINAIENSSKRTKGNGASKASLQCTVEHGVGAPFVQLMMPAHLTLGEHRQNNKK